MRDLSSIFWRTAAALASAPPFGPARARSGDDPFPAASGAAASFRLPSRGFLTSPSRPGTEERAGLALGEALAGEKAVPAGIFYPDQNHALHVGKKAASISYQLGIPEKLV